jgi:hypothetical protein
MKSVDGGHTWSTTGLSYLQTNKDIIQRLLISPKNPNILLAATRNGMLRTTDAGATWTNVDPGHIYSMAFRPNMPDTIYCINTYHLEVSYDAGATWSVLSTGINPTNDRATIAVSPASPRSIWVLDAAENLKWSHNQGAGFSTTNPPDTAHFYVITTVYWLFHLPTPILFLHLVPLCLYPIQEELAGQGWIRIIKYM